MFQVKFTPTAAQVFRKLQPEIKKHLKSALKLLSEKPFAGKSLRNELSDFRSFKINRYRVIYHLIDETQTLVVVGLGHRRDIYEVMTRLVDKS